MFTGIVEGVGKILKIKHAKNRSVFHITIDLGKVLPDVKDFSVYLDDKQIYYIENNHLYNKNWILYNQICV